MSVQHFSSSQFKDIVLKSELPVVVDFYAQWCGPCKIAAPIVDKLAQEYENKVLIGKVDVDDAQDIAQQYGVMSIPTMIVFKNGQEVERKVGFPGESGLRALVEKLVV